MIDNELIFIDLLKEFYLTSLNQKNNLVLSLLVTDNINILAKFKGKIEVINKTINNYSLTRNLNKQDLYYFLITFFLLYYSENVAYYNYKFSIDKNIFSNFDIDKKSYKSDIKYYVINLDGSFLTCQDIHEKKRLILSRLISIEISKKDSMLIKGIINQQNNFIFYNECIDEILDEIEFIESFITDKLLEIPKLINFSYIISDQDYLSKLQSVILNNSDQLNEWTEIYSLNDEKNSINIETEFSNFYLNSDYFPPNMLTSLNFDVKKNNNNDFEFLDGLMIHGDNFKALRYLQKSFTSKIDCIYIDPPYNTGSNDFLYNDDISKINWFWMLENRLQIAYSLLNDDGVIFISIDDNEIVSVRTIMDLVFDRFVGMFVWHKKTQPSFLNKELISVTEYILVYKKGLNPIKMKGGFTDPNKHTELLNISNDVSERYLPKNNTIIYNKGSLFTGAIEKGVYGNHKLKVTLKNTIKVSHGISNEDIVVVGRFRWTQTKINNIYIENRKIVIKSLKTLRPTVSGSGTAKIRPPISLLSKKINDIPTNTDGNFEMKHFFKIPPFYYPKPVELIKFLIDSVTYNNKNAIILDFFAGSGTTGHAVINLNREDSGKRKFIIIEEADYFDTILVPRIKKCLYSDRWENGIPLNPNNISSYIKIIKLSENFKNENLSD